MSRLFKILVICLCLSLGVLVSISSVNESKDLEERLESIQLENHAVYLLLRGSQTKMGGFARQYNRFGGLASHVALGIFTDSLTIYHVNTGSANPMREETLAEFIHSEEESYNYLAIWKIRGMTPNKLYTLQNNIALLQSDSIRFDYRFNFEDDSALYCSEFIYKVLEPINPELFKETLYKKVVPKEHRFFLKKDSLEYLPADFFLNKKDLVEAIFFWESQN